MTKPVSFLMPNNPADVELAKKYCCNAWMAWHPGKPSMGIIATA